MQITKLLRQKGINPIMTQITTPTKIVSEKNKYIMTQKFGVYFDELDCTEHDSVVYNKALDDLKNKFIQSVNENYFFSGEFKEWVLYAIEQDAEQLNDVSS